MNFWSKLLGRHRAIVSESNNLTFEQKLAILAECGLVLDPQFSVDDLLTSWSREDYESPGFNLVLVGLGMTEEQPPWRPHSANVWHFDTECIEDHGSYVDIAERMKAIAQGSLPIENLADYVDVEEGKAWLEFDVHGQRRHIDCKVDDDWVDVNLFKHFVDLLATSDPSKTFVYYDLQGQDCIIACVTKSQLAALNKSGVAFERLRWS